MRKVKVSIEKEEKRRTEVGKNGRSEGREKGDEKVEERNGEKLRCVGTRLEGNERAVRD